MPCVAAEMFVRPSKIYPSKILEGLTKDEMRIFEALFKGVSTLFGLRTIEKYIENLDFIFCQSFQNLRLGGIKSFGEHKFDSSTFQKNSHESQLYAPQTKDFRSTFQVREQSTWGTNHWKVNRKSGVLLLSIPPKSSFGSVKLESQLHNLSQDDDSMTMCL